jgi:predicted component of type VI protein secretion system
MARLRVVSGPLAGQTIEVENELVIGRQDTDLTIDDLELSRRHAVVRRHANRLQVEDLGSSNGTFVDGTRIDEPALVGGGTEIRIGTTVLVVEGVLPVQATEPENAAPSAESIAPDLARDVTRVQAVPPPPPKPETAVSAGATAASPSPPAAAPPGPAAPSPVRTPQTPVGEFRPPERAHRGGIATRSWVAVALSFGTAIAVAIALIVFFATSG